MTLRRGTTLIELLIFIAVLGLVVATALPLLFSSTENRFLQQTISVVEQNGAQIVQNVTLRVRHAERILHPPLGETGSFLVLQTASGVTHPQIIGFSGGSLIIVEHTTREEISSPQVAVQDFVVRNTSVSSTRQSVAITFRVSRTIKLQQPRTYARRFSMAAVLPPNDVPVGNACGCTPPSCFGNNTIGWQVCENTVCLSATTSMQCP